MTIKMNERKLELVLSAFPRENAESMARAFVKADLNSDINFKEIVKTEAKCTFHLQVYLFALQMDILQDAVTLLKKIFFDNENKFSNELYNKFVACFFAVAPDAYTSDYYKNNKNLDIFDEILHLFAALLKQINTQLTEDTFVAGLNSILTILNTVGITDDCKEGYFNLFDQYFFKKSIPVQKATNILESYRKTLNLSGIEEKRMLINKGSKVPTPEFRCAARHWAKITKSAAIEMFRFSSENAKRVMPIFTQIKKLSEKFDKDNGPQELFKLMVFDAVYSCIYANLFTKNSQFIRDYSLDPFLAILNSDGYIDVFIAVISEDIDLQKFLCNLCDFIGYGTFEPESKWVQIFITFIRWILEVNNDSSYNFRAFINSATVLAARKPEIIRSLTDPIKQAASADPISDSSSWVNTLYSILTVSPTPDMWSIATQLFISSALEVPIPYTESFIYNFLNRLILLLCAPAEIRSVDCFVRLLYKFLARLIDNERHIPDWFGGADNPASKLLLTMCLMPQMSAYFKYPFLKSLFVGLHSLAGLSTTAFVAACLVTIENVEFLGKQKVLAWFVKLFSERAKKNTPIGKLAFYTAATLRNGLTTPPCDLKDKKPEIYGLSKSGNIISIYNEEDSLVCVTRSSTGISAVRVSEQKRIEKVVSEDNLKSTIIRKAALQLEEPLPPFKEYNNAEPYSEKSKALKMLIDHDVHGLRPLPSDTDFSAFDQLCAPSDIEVSLVRYGPEGITTDRLEWLRALVSGCPETRLARISMRDGISPGRTRFVVAISERSVNPSCPPQELLRLATIVVVPAGGGLVRVLPLSPQLTGDGAERLMQPLAAAKFIAYHAYINEACVRRAGRGETGCPLADAFVARCEQRAQALDELIRSSSVKGMISAASYVLSE